MNNLALIIAIFLGLNGNIYSNQATVIANTESGQLFEDCFGNLWETVNDDCFLLENQVVTLYFSDNNTVDITDDYLFMIETNNCIILNK